MADEHFIPGTSRITEIESFHRYFVAAELCRNCRVLDAASGDGYGSAILAAKAAQVTGIDLNQQASYEAAQKYFAENLNFVNGDVAAMPFGDGSFDRVVSFETIEHIPDQKKFLQEVRRVLTPGGVLILSSPNRTPFRTRNGSENSYHINELESGELRELLSEYFPNIHFYAQDAFYNSVITGDGEFAYYVKNKYNKIVRQEALDRVQYSIVIASAKELPSLTPSCYLDAFFDSDRGYVLDDEAVVHQFGLRGEFEKIYKNFVELQQSHQALSDEKNACAAQNQEFAAAIESLRQTNGQLEEDKNVQNSRNEELTEAVNSISKAIDSLQQHNFQLSEENSGIRQQLMNLTGECRAREAECSGYMRTITEKDQQNQDLLAVIDANKGLICELEQKVKDAIIELGNRGFTIQNLKEQLEDASTELGNRSFTIQNLKEQLEDASAELSNRSFTIQNLKEQLEDASTELGNRGFTIQNLKEQLKDAAAEIGSRDSAIQSLNGQLNDAWTEIGSRDSAIQSLSSQLNEEHAKAEYLYHEYNEIKNSFALRIFGRFQLRRKARELCRRIALCAHAAGRFAMKAVPLKYSTRMAFKDFIYTRFSNQLQNLEGYRQWHLHYAGLQALKMEEDTGLIVPKDVPLTSIIIPVYNNIELTRRCLHTIYNVGSRSPFEVVIVDDCSTDDYASLKKDFPEVRVIRNEKNSGFLLTVNRGAEEAKGEYILILNNDTEVVTGWLDELTTALYKHPEAGMIGSQLVHLRTGTLQESGNLICKNGDMMPLGRGESPNHPRFNYFREVDFCSAASIIMRKKVFDEMDGFDRIYVPAYFEDPDLGMRLKKAGYKNYVCPLSRVLHQEMASYGDALDDKCAKNRGVFMNRWSKYLEENALYRDRNEPAECMKFPRPRIMYIDAETPMADRGSGGMDAIFFMEYMLKRGYDVVFHGEYTPGYVPKYTTILLRMGVECICQPERKIWEYLETTGWTFTHIFVSRIYQARCFDWLFKKYCPTAAYIFDTVDVHFVREQLEADLKDDDRLRRLAAETKQYELAVARSADATIVISSDEKKLLENDYKLTNVYHIPQARELFGLAPNPNRRGAVFIGSAHPPNMDGLRYFHDEILPLLPKDFKLTIIGESLKMMMGKSDEYKDLLKCPQFNFVGFVQDLADELDNTMITVAPLRYGAGTKGKVASSMSYGIPCVSSCFGTEGTGMVHGENIMIAKTPQEFADYIKQLFEDQELWKRISDGGIKFIRDNYAPEAVEKMMDALFADVDKRVREKRSAWANTPVVPKVD